MIRTAVIGFALLGLSGCEGGRGPGAEAGPVAVEYETPDPGDAGPLPTAPAPRRIETH